ncbi:MAG: ABC transporter ATP-binding protein [Chloroflexi bacterium]|nr:ABC transporter ATP-binding protein [Chloroflexota bacterium]
MYCLEFRQANFSYNGNFRLRPFDLVIGVAENVALIGPNGAGKSTLMKLASGVLHPSQGEVRLNGCNLAALHPKQIARKVAMVPQELSIPFTFSVTEMVLLGRTPYVHLLRGYRSADMAIARRAMELTDTLQFADRTFNELSGGERQRVILAMALAQEPELLLLDEPVAHLDIAHQAKILDLVRDLNLRRGLTVIAAMHDLNLAALYFERLILIHQGQIIADGSPETVLKEDIIESVFGSKVNVATNPATGVPHVFTIPR